MDQIRSKCSELLQSCSRVFLNCRPVTLQHSRQKASRCASRFIRNNLGSASVYPCSCSLRLPPQVLQDGAKPVGDVASGHLCFVVTDCCTHVLPYRLYGPQPLSLLAPSVFLAFQALKASCTKRIIFTRSQTPKVMAAAAALAASSTGHAAIADGAFLSCTRGIARCAFRKYAQLAPAGLQDPSW